MRSRYCAYVLRRTDYLLETWHPRSRPSRLDPGPAGLKWLGLDVRQYVRLDETHAQVEFVARCKENGRATRLHETSRFERVEGRWMYVDGVVG
jgi:SEC-C motif-containing protein